MTLKVHDNERLSAIFWRNGILVARLAVRLEVVVRYPSQLAGLPESVKHFKEHE